MKGKTEWNAKVKWYNDGGDVNFMKEISTSMINGFVFSD
jgi:hypothetical protein